MQVFTKSIPVVFIMLFASLSACSSGGGDSGGGGSKFSGKFPTNCVQIPSAKESSVVWTYEECGPFTNGDFLQFHYDQVGHIPSGSSYARRELGTIPVDKGNMTFKYTDFDWSDMPWGDDTVIVAFLTQNANETMEVANWHMLGIRMSRDGQVLTKLVTQRFDGICLPDAAADWGGKCNKEHQEFDMPLYNGFKTYRFDCSWDTTAPSLFHGQSSSIKDGSVQCDVYDATGPTETLIQTYRAPTSGPYTRLDTVLVGGRIGQVFKKAIMHNVMEDFRITIYK